MQQETLYFKIENRYLANLIRATQIKQRMEYLSPSVLQYTAVHNSTQNCIWMAYFFSNSKTYAVIVLYRDNVDISVRKRTVLSPIFLACFPNL